MDKTWRNVKWEKQRMRKAVVRLFGIAAALVLAQPVCAQMANLPASGQAKIAEIDPVLNPEMIESIIALLRPVAEATPRIPRNTGSDSAVAMRSDTLLASLVCVRDGKCPRFIRLKGHTHISEAASFDTRDRELGRAIVDFIHAEK
jgi:hypothetical protein